jgi:hypothetical protein
MIGAKCRQRNRTHPKNLRTQKEILHPKRKRFTLLQRRQQAVKLETITIIEEEI